MKTEIIHNQIAHIRLHELQINHTNGRRYVMRRLC